MTDSVNLRNLELIQEHEGNPSRRLGALVLASSAGAAIVVAFFMMSKTEGKSVAVSSDPLAALVTKARQESVPPERLAQRDVSFPGILSDDERPTTALAAVKDERGRLVELADAGAPGQGDAPPPPALDALPVVPLPAGSLLNATPVTTAPKDELAKMAAEVSTVGDGTALAPLGSDSGYQIQVASFKDQPDADHFVDDLRKRGHSAFRLSVDVPGRGLWHRVRVGPFKSKYEAVQYKKKFEDMERVAPFVVDPDRVRLDVEIRAQKLAARIKKYGRP